MKYIAQPGTPVTLPRPAAATQRQKKLTPSFMRLMLSLPRNYRGRLIQMHYGIKPYGTY